MTLLGLIVIVLVLVNIVWGFQTNFRGSWPFWFNFIGSILLAIITFTGLL